MQNTGDVRTQEEMLNKSQGLAEKADYSSLKAQILPRAQRLCLATTSAGVRQASFRALTSLAPRFDKEVASEFITTTQQVHFLHLIQFQRTLHRPYASILSVFSYYLQKGVFLP